MYAIFSTSAYWGRCNGGANCTTCHDTSFGGITVLDPAAAAADPHPAGSVPARLDALLGSRGNARKVHSTSTGAGSGFAWDAEARPPKRTHARRSRGVT